MFKLEILEFNAKAEKWETFRTFFVDTMNEVFETFKLFAKAFNSVGVSLGADIYSRGEDDSFTFEFAL